MAVPSQYMFLDITEGYGIKIGKVRCEVCKTDPLIFLTRYIFFRNFKLFVMSMYISYIFNDNKLMFRRFFGGFTKFFGVKILNCDGP